MQNKSLIENLIALNNASKNFIEDHFNFNLELENKVLFYIACNKSCRPGDIIKEFRIKKTNLALLCKKLLDNNLICKEQDFEDLRSIKYSITFKGEQILDKIFENSENFADKEKTIISQINKTINILKE